jgi:hypothetical protein
MGGEAPKAGCIGPPGVNPALRSMLLLRKFKENI